jgi:hypothetical protein
VTRGRAIVRVKDRKGLAMIAQLVASPGTPIPALDLAAEEAEGPIDLGDAGPRLDDRARRAYVARLAELRKETEEAEAWNDAGRLALLRDEAETIERELRAAVGLGGRARRSAGAIERARVNAQRRIRDAIERISELEPEIGRHLARSIRTGRICAYDPE